MPALSKKAISLYLRTGCQRQFSLQLYTDTELETHRMPPREHSRAGLTHVGKEGYKWQDEVVQGLKKAFPSSELHADKKAKGDQYNTLQLAAILPSVKPYSFIVEAEYEGDTQVFREALGLENLTDYYNDRIRISALRVDILHVLPSMSSAGIQHKYDDPSTFAVGSDGKVVPLKEDDNRMRLRVIDVKLSAEPGAHYFGEVVYYSMALAAWLKEKKIDNAFVVVSSAAVWPGTHTTTNLAASLQLWEKDNITPTLEDVTKVMESDIETTPFEVVAARLRRLLMEEVPVIVRSPWDHLQWHVGVQCKGCEFLGYPWLNSTTGKPSNDQAQCYPTSENTGDLARVVGLTRGGAKKLKEGGVFDISSLAATLPSNSVFAKHQGLKAKRTTYPHRANSLTQSSTFLIPNTGTDASMPKWPDLRIYLFLDYDLATALTSTFGYLAFWREPLPYSSTLVPDHLRWPKLRSAQEEELDEWEDSARQRYIDRLATVHPVRHRTVAEERATFILFLRELKAILTEVEQQDAIGFTSQRRDNKTRRSTYQIYLWDEGQRKHLIRLAGRHLGAILADPDIKELAWLFPPPELLAHPEDATRQTPITIVSTVIQNTIAAPIPYQYNLLELAKHYLPAKAKPIRVHPLYQEPLSDLIPAERIHEAWSPGANWQQALNTVVETTRKKVYALSLITRRLEGDIRVRLSGSTAPKIDQTNTRLSNVAPHSLLWLEYAKLNAAFDQLEVHAIHAMAPHEREARFKSALLQRRLIDQEASDVLAKINLSFIPGLFVYQLEPDSIDVNLRAGDIGFAIAPRDRTNFHDESTYAHLNGTGIPFEKRYIGLKTFGRAGVTDVSIVDIDRHGGHIVLRGGMFNQVALLESRGIANFSQNVSLDPMPTDFLTDKLELTLSAIGYPASATADSGIMEAIGFSTKSRRRFNKESVASQFLWDAQNVFSQDITRDTDTLKNGLVGVGINLNGSQWRAWESALSKRLTLIWGPPGTGKSKTLTSIITSVVLNAIQTGAGLRLLVTANTYNAVDNVLLKIHEQLDSLLGEDSSDAYSIVRLQSQYRDNPNEILRDHPEVESIILDTYSPTDETVDLVNQLLLAKKGEIIIVGAPVQQVHNLAIAGISKANRLAFVDRQFFDFVVLDEASQLDVASSTMIFTKIAEGGSCVLAGDDLQLPPIHPADPPKGLESIVGSIYNYFAFHHNIPYCPLQINYRSNSTIVEFTKKAGYDLGLRSNSPDLKLNFLSPVPTTKPIDWPEELYWTPEWHKLLAADQPTVCIVYDDDSSSQVNAFEADAVAALTWLLKGRLSNQLSNERKPDGKPIAETGTAYTNDFWDRALGVVTPHRAQMSRVVQRLQKLFPSDSPEQIRSAVDTVERFQGQQRDIIIASFGVGDPDIISNEDEFLYDLRRFNVLASRARAKLIVFVTKSLVDHLSNDSNVLRESVLLKNYADVFCHQVGKIKLGYIQDGNDQLVEAVLRAR